MAHVKTLCKLPSKRCSIPVLGMVKFADGYLTTTDMDFYIKIEASDMAHRLTDDTLYDPLSLQNELFDIESSISSRDFPHMGSYGAEKASVELNKDFIPLLEWLLKAAGNDARRHYLNGVYFDPAGQVVATDGHRLHSFEHKLNHTSKVKKEQEGYIIPKKTMKYALCLLKETNIDAFSITFYGNNKAEIKIGPHLIETKLVDGTFPNWRRVVPEHRKKTNFDPIEWQKIVKEATLLKKIGGMGFSKSVFVKIIDGEAEFTTHIESQPIKKWHISTNTKEIIGFNARYAADLMPGDWFYGSPGDPIVIKGFDVVPLTGVLMPMRA